jgi:hypothetical protein
MGTVERGYVAKALRRPTSLCRKGHPDAGKAGTKTAGETNQPPGYWISFASLP